MSRGMIMTRLGLPIAALAAISVQTAPASAQSSASPFTYATRYDAAGRVPGPNAPDPDGAGALKYDATPTTSAADGRPARIDTGDRDHCERKSRRAGRRGAGGEDAGGRG